MSRFLSGMQRSIENVIARAVIRLLNSSTKCQTADLVLIGGDEKEGVEHIEPYGFTASAQPGAEGIVLFPDGDRSHGVVITVADRRYRLQGLKSGEVAIYTDEGDSIVLKRGKIIEATTDQFIVNATKKITFNTPLLEVPTGEMSDRTSTMSAMREIYDGHDHHENGDGGGVTDATTQKMG